MAGNRVISLAVCIWLVFFSGRCFTWSSEACSSPTPNNNSQFCTWVGGYLKKTQTASGNKKLDFKCCYFERVRSIISTPKLSWTYCKQNCALIVHLHWLLLCWATFLPMSAPYLWMQIASVYQQVGFCCFVFFFSFFCKWQETMFLTRCRIMT